MEASDTTVNEGPDEVNDSLDVAALKTSLAHLTDLEEQATSPVDAQSWKDAFGDKVRVMDVADREQEDGEADGFELSGTF